MSDGHVAAIIGLGLIGGSLARDLAAREVHVRGHDTDVSNLDAAVHAGFVAERLDDSLAGVRDADLVVIAVPVDAATDVLRRVAPHTEKAKLITDVGSTKSRIVALASELGIGERFVGSHPLAGDHRSGWDASRSALFANARVYLCPTSNTTQTTVSNAKTLWTALGANPVVTSAERHDQMLAWTSHLPHMISAALALTLAECDVERDDLGPGGRDVTRLAGGSPDVWTAIALENAAAIETALASAERQIAAMRGALSRADAGALRERLSSARAWFDV